MGRKTPRSKEKKLQRKEDKQRLAAAQVLVEKANQQEDPLVRFPAFQQFNKNGVTVTLECKRCPHLDKETLDWAFQLVKTNMKPFYDACDWGWNDKKKYEEMTNDYSWYLIARTEERKPVGLAHFRFDMDYGDEVLYCYELQLEMEVQRKGLGKFMLQVLELIGFTAQMRKVILTVLTNNRTAEAFFEALKYTTDETSPEEFLYETLSYKILSKLNKHLALSAK